MDVLRVTAQGIGKRFPGKVWSIVLAAEMGRNDALQAVTGVWIFRGTEGLPDLPLWGLADAEKPCQDAAAGVADMAGQRLSIQLYVGPDTDTAARAVVGSTEAAKRCVLAGMGLSFLSRHAVADELVAGRLEIVPLPGTPVARRFWVVWLRDRSPSSAAAALLSLLRASAPAASDERPTSAD